MSASEEHHEEHVPEVSTVEITDTPLHAHSASDAEEEVQALPESPLKDENDIENLVQMLESGMPAPIKLSMPDGVAAEIPDEE